jgi:DNA-binding MarR family transcriptional regulator
MKHYKAENIIGALALTLSDVMLEATRNEAPSNILAAGLTLIGHVPGISIYELSSGIGLSHPGTVRLVDRMVADDLVERARSETDGRAVALFLTLAGKTREQSILSSRRTVLSSALSSLSSEEHESLAQIAAKLVTAILTDEEHALKICRLCDSDACNDCPVEAELSRKPTA